MSRAKARFPIPLAAAVAGTLAVIAGQLLRFPALLRNGIDGAPFSLGVLEFPLSYTLTAPFSALADCLTFNSVRQHWVWLLYLLAACAIAAALRRGYRRRLTGFLRNLLAVLLFLAWGALWPRPAARLAASSPDQLVVDFHSHTTHSHDGRRVPPAFTPAENIRWHKRQGFGAAFVTDHNNFAGSQAAYDLSRADHERAGYRSLLGEELSLHDAHIVALGNERLIDTKRYTDGIEGLRRFLSTGAAEHGALSVLSLPEYWKHHRDRLETLIAWGADGIELANGAPKSRELTPGDRNRIVELARRYNVFLCGASDAHGWGSAAYAWNLMDIPGHTVMSAPQLQQAVLDELRDKRFRAVTVATRIKNPPASGAWILFDPIAGLWTLLRSMPPAQALISIAWCWLICLLAQFIRSRPSSSSEITV
ncbi:MAG: hypothetical protein ABIJ96_10525 [Elusimicrobiota bacterium]